MNQNDIAESTRDFLVKMARLKSYMESLKNEPTRSLLQDKIDELEAQIGERRYALSLPAVRAKGENCTKPRKKGHLTLVVNNDV